MNQHTRLATRRWHFAGTICSIVCLIYSLLFNLWFLIFVPFLGYGLSWYSHFFVEGNVPATFRHPFWSLLCDFKMFGLMLTGQMDREMKRLGKRPVLQAYWSSSFLLLASLNKPAEACFAIYLLYEAPRVGQCGPRPFFFFQIFVVVRTSTFDLYLLHTCFEVKHKSWHGIQVLWNEVIVCWV